MLSLIEKTNSCFFYYFFQMHNLLLKIQSWKFWNCGLSVTNPASPCINQFLWTNCLFWYLCITQSNHMVLLTIICTVSSSKFDTFMQSEKCLVTITFKISFIFHLKAAYTYMFYSWFTFRNFLKYCYFVHITIHFAFGTIFNYIVKIKYLFSILKCLYSLKEGIYKG